jgi:hypothetical protein
LIGSSNIYPDNINIFYKLKRINQSKDAIQFIESKWRHFVSNNPNSFNGALFHVDSYNIQNNNNNNLIELQLKDIGHASKEECHNIFNVYVNADGSSIDTANNYDEGTSENILVNL